MGTWPVLKASDLDLTLDTWDFTQTLNDTLGDLGTPADGFDSYLNDTILLLSGLENLGGSLLDDLNLAAGIAGTIDPTSLNSDAASLPGTLATGDSIVADANALLGSVGPPPPAPGGGGGSGGGGGQPKTGCGTHGASTVDTTVKVDPQAGFVYLPVASVVDGPCKTSLSVSPGASGERGIVGWRLLQGDHNLFVLGTHRSDPSTGTVIWYYDVTVNPTTPGKYWMEAQLDLNPPPFTLKLYYWLDVIP